MSSFNPAPPPRPSPTADELRRVTEERLVEDAEQRERDRWGLWRGLVMVVVGLLVTGVLYLAVWFVWRVVEGFK